jgi:hypothetical protein
MNGLQDLAIEAHGGWRRWQEITSIRAHVAVGGTVWSLKGWPGALADVHVTADPHSPHVEYSPFLKAGQRGVYEPACTSLVSDGKTIGQRESPRQSFAGHSLATPWDPHHLVYFAGYAMWTYLTTPFLFRLPGVRTEEVEPWNEGGETWRRLRVLFPASLPSHSTEQTFYFDELGLLRRHDYSVEVMGGTSSANYASGHKSFGGLVFPTRRRVYAKGPDNRPLLDRLAVAIDFLDLEVR